MMKHFRQIDLRHRTVALVDFWHEGPPALTWPAEPPNGLIVPVLRPPRSQSGRVRAMAACLVEPRVPAVAAKRDPI